MMNKYDDDLRKLRDEFIRFKREVTDTLENLDEGNFSGNMKKLIARLGSSSAGFEAYADAKQAVARMFAEYKTEINKSIASVEAVADANSSKINAIAKYEGDIKSIASIEETADANGAFIKMLVSAGSTDKNPEDITETEIAGIYISAMNNSAAAQTESTIALNANVIKFGDYASVDDNGSLRIKRLYHYGGNQFYAQVGNDTGSFADFGVYDEANGYWAWRFFNNDMATKVIHLRIYEDDIFGYNGLERKTYPKGAWDFSSCSVSNIPLYFS